MCPDEGSHAHCSGRCRWWSGLCCVINVLHSYVPRLRAFLSYLRVMIMALSIIIIVVWPFDCGLSSITTP